MDKNIKSIKKKKNLRYTYKFFTPTETIGSIAWLLKRKIILKILKQEYFRIIEIKSLYFANLAIRIVKLIV